jgi:FkbM family methyltransferase
VGVLSLPGRSLAAIRRRQCSRLGISVVHGHHILARPLDGSSVVVDAGANTGGFAGEIVRRFASQVLALEPVEELRARIPLAAEISALPLALAARSGPMELFLADNPEANSRFREIAEASVAVSVEAATLDQVVERAGGRVHLLKIDIEGEEVPVLESLSIATAAVIDQISVEFHDFVEGFTAAARIRPLLRRMETLGYRPLVLSSCRGDHSDVLFLKQDGLGTWARLQLAILAGLMLPAERFVDTCRRRLRRERS